MEPPRKELRIVNAADLHLEDPLKRRFPFQRAPRSAPFVFEYFKTENGRGLSLGQYTWRAGGILRRLFYEGRASRWAR